MQAQNKYQQAKRKNIYIIVNKLKTIYLLNGTVLIQVNDNKPGNNAQDKNLSTSQ